MYTIVTYMPVFSAVLIVGYIAFKRADGNLNPLFLVMIEFGIGLGSSLARTEMFLRDIGLFANVPEDLFIQGVRGCWLPTLLAFIASFFLIAISRFRGKPASK